MADEQTQENDVVEPANGESPASDGTKVPDWASQSPEAMYKELERTRKEAAKARQKVQELLDAQQAEKLAEQGKWKELYEKVQADNSKLQQSLQERDLAVKRVEVAVELGLPPALASRLTGSTDEELRKDAETLKALLGGGGEASKQQAAPGGRLATTTGVPGGQPAGESDVQKRTRLLGGGGTDVFKKGPVVIK